MVERFGGAVARRQDARRSGVPSQRGRRRRAAPDHVGQEKRPAVRAQKDYVIRIAAERRSRSGGNQSRCDLETGNGGRESIVQARLERGDGLSRSRRAAVLRPKPYRDKLRRRPR